MESKPGGGADGEEDDARVGATKETLSVYPLKLIVKELIRMYL